MNTADSLNQVPENLKNIFDHLKKIAFDWQKKFPVYIQNGIPAPGLNQLQASDYLETLQTYLGQQTILPEQLLNNRLTKLSSNPKLTTSAMPQGYRICLCVVPFNFNGNELTETEIQNGFHLQEMIIDQNNTAYCTLSPKGSALYQAMPLEIQNLSFLSDGNREHILDEYQKTFRRAQAFYNKTT